ncbi:MAG: hypothetical protein ACLQUY_21285 [Ktedonobacterales bacterium]
MKQEAVSDGEQQRITGVVLIHGLGLIPRNDMLQRSLNALSYWFNHEVGLPMRPEGEGRLWLAPHLTDDPDPDQSASRAIVDLVAPRPAESTKTESTKTDSSPSPDAAARLELREVWWAESFGAPNIAQTISWAQVQWREQAGRLLIPVGRRPQPERSDDTPPANELPPAVTNPPAEMDADRAHLSQPSRRALLSMLWLYSLYQYIWKAVQWLVLTPVITLLLLVMGIVQVLGGVPFLGSAIVSATTALINTVMLHWVAEIQVYLTDYTRSSAIRQRFQNEVEDLLRNPLCDRVVVIAESGGTYIAYEGLTTLLEQPDLPLDDQGQPKPVTFICIASALRRIWLLANTDAERMHGVLPKYVRWLHFWAEYDPVAAGPLTEKSIPRITTWDPPEENPYGAIRDSLGRCENIRVSNTDSTFTDHVSYWDNIEQVIGPIACELVAGHPVLEQAVRGKLASPSEVLLREWNVAWRYTLAFAGGIAAGVALLVWGLTNPEFANFVKDLGNAINWSSLLGSVCTICGPLPHQNPFAQLLQNITQHGASYTQRFAGLNALTGVITHFLKARVIIVAVGALAVMGLVDTLIARLASMPTPYTFPNLDVALRQRLGSIFVACAAGIGLMFVASLFYRGLVYPITDYFPAVPRQQIAFAYIWALALGELMYVLALLATLVAIIQQRRWGWGIGLIFALTPLTMLDPFYRSAMLAVAVAGCVICLFRPFQSGGTAARVALALVAVMCVDVGIGTTLFRSDVLRTPLLGAGVWVEDLLPPLVYALWSGGTTSSARAARANRLRRTVLLIGLAYLGLVSLLTIYSIITNQAPAPVAALTGPAVIHQAPSVSPFTTITTAVALLLGILMLLLGMVSARNERRWGWVIAIPIIFIVLTAGLAVFSQLGVVATLPGGLLPSFTLVAAALIYALWAGQGRWRPRQKSAELQPVAVPVPVAMPVPDAVHV